LGGDGLLDQIPRHALAPNGAPDFPGEHKLDLTTADLFVQPYRGDKSLPLKGLSTDGISAEGAFLNKKHTYTYGAHAAHVAVVDVPTRKVQGYILVGKRCSDPTFS